MVEGPLLLVIFVFSIAILLVSIIKFKVNPFIAILSTAILTGFMVRMPMNEIGSTMTKGFGNTLGGVGIVIGLGIILGVLLAESNAINQIAEGLLNKVGTKKAPLAINLTGYLISIPVFQDAAFVIFMPLIRNIAQKIKKPLIVLVAALGVGTITSHALVIPTPGPLAVADNMGANIGLFLIYAIIVSIPATLVGGWYYGSFLGRRKEYAELDSVAETALTLDDEGDSTSTQLQERPSLFLSLFVLILPIILILFGNILRLLLPEGATGTVFLGFIGDKNVALLIGVLFAIVTLKKYFRVSVEDLVIKAAQSAGIIFLITGAGGAYGTIINSSGIGDYLVVSMTNLSISLIVLGFLLSQILRAAQGSTTVALVTASAILGPAAATMGISPILVGLAICAGGIGLSLPNDSGFWVISKFGNLSVKDTIKAWTVGGTISGVTAFVMVLILSLFSGILPGL